MLACAQSGGHRAPRACWTCPTWASWPGCWRTAGGLSAADLLAAIGAKNAHEVAALRSDAGIPQETCRLLQALIRIAGPLQEALPQVQALPLPEASHLALAELAQLSELLALQGVAQRVNLDFSIVSAMESSRTVSSSAAMSTGSPPPLSPAGAMAS